jgi:hypothetical protein
MWLENDVKVERLATKIRIMRNHYIEKNPNATPAQIESFLKRKLSSESRILYAEQARIINDALSQA